MTYSNKQKRLIDLAIKRKQVSSLFLKGDMMAMLWPDEADRTKAKLELEEIVGQENKKLENLRLM